MRTASAALLASSVPVYAGFGWFNASFNGNFWNTPIVHSDIWDLELKWLSVGFDFDWLHSSCTTVRLPGGGVSELELQLSAGAAYISDVPGANATVAAQQPLQCVSGESPLLGAVTSIVDVNLSSAFGLDEDE